MTIFSAHGKLALTIVGNIIYLEAQGPWNMEFIGNLHKQLLWAVTQVDQSNYGVLFTPKGEAISVEPGLEYHINFIRQGNTQAIALNLAHCTTPLLTENLFSKLYRTANINHAFFDHAFEAKTWLDAELNAVTAITP
tara:strand:- start:101 stop:511 length:411 start_codon:yes stop_codon:yes gene_type:complete